MGCHVAFLLQHPEFLERRHSIHHLGGELLEHTALLVMALIGRNFIENRPAWKAAALAKHTRLPPKHVYQVIELLLEHGYLTEAGLTQTQLLPERDLSSISIKQLLQDMRSSDSELRLDRRGQHPYDKVAGLMANLQQLQDDKLAPLTLRDLAAKPSDTNNKH